MYVEHESCNYLVRAQYTEYTYKACIVHIRAAIPSHAHSLLGLGVLFPKYFFFSLAMEKKWKARLYGHIT